jgi:uncharacterized membrane protein YhaH (DUF805 family)
MNVSKRRKFKSDRNRDAFNRWHDHQINQITTVSATVFALASAGLGYSLSLLSDEKVTLLKANVPAIRLFTFAFAISFVAALLLVVNRLEDFRRTKNIVRLRDDDPQHPELESRRRVVNRFERWTWILFYVQFIAFIVGGATIIVFFWYNYGSKLKP